VDYLYSLYDALVSIHVPSDKARAVVDAMERDMGTTLATKQDLKLLEHQLAGVRTELRQEIENRYELLSREIGSCARTWTRTSAHSAAMSARTWRRCACR
jgi:hypothetical protein